MEITRRLEFDAGHRVLGHGGKCRHLHGHRYRAEITVGPTRGLDELGMVIDFGLVKELVGAWIDTNWDHNMILHPEDPLRYFLDDSERQEEREPYVMPEECNPTAENLAIVLFHKSRELLTPQEMRVRRVRIYETPNCWADYHE